MLIVCRSLNAYWPLFENGWNPSTIAKRSLTSIQAMVLSYENMSSSCSPNLRFTGNIPNSMASLSTRSTSVSSPSMTQTKGEPADSDESTTRIMADFNSYETISDLMTLQDQIDAFQKLIFSHFRGGANNECRIAALVPLVQESYGIYKFITSMLRAMHTSMSVLKTS